MLEAGRNSLCAFSSNKVFPVSRDTTFTPTIADDSSGLSRISLILACNSARDLVGFEAFSCGTTVGDDGLATGEAEGDGLGCGAAGGCSVAWRWRCAGMEAPAGTVVSQRASNTKSASLDLCSRLIMFV